MPTPENTSKRDPLLHLAGAMAEGSSDYITGMEADGQRQIVHSDVLPVESHTGDQWLIDHGFQLGDAVEGDELFRQVTLPDGWKRVGSSHAMHSYIHDERDLPMVNVFYKAAFYDRRADWSPVNPGYTTAGAFLYGDRESIPWDKFTDGERAVAIRQLQEYTPEGRYAKYADEDKIARAVAELERIGAPPTA
jgi:hypothetical protein